MSAATKWIFAIVGLLAGNLVAMAVLLGAAKADGSRVLPNYYEQAVRYDEAIDQAARNRELGWRVDARFAGGELLVDVRDRDGRALDGATTRVSAMSRATGGIVEGQGRELAGTWHGVYDVTIHVRRGNDTFVERVTAEAR